jgi:hypothetical protein
MTTRRQTSLWFYTMSLYCGYLLRHMYILHLGIMDGGALGSMVTHVTYEYIQILSPFRTYALFSTLRERITYRSTLWWSHILIFPLRWNYVYMSIMIIVLIPFLLGLCWANEALKKYFLKNFILNGEKPHRLLQRNETSNSLFMNAQATDL